MLDSMSMGDAGVIARDHNRELTDLAETMLCPLHSRCVDSKEKVQGVVAQWKNHIKTSIRLQAPAPPLDIIGTKALAVEYQPTNAPVGIRGRRFNALPEQTATIPQGQPRIQPTAFSVSPLPEAPPTTYGATIDQAAVGDLMKAFQGLSLQNHKLRDQNQKLRDENAQLVERRDTAAREHRRAKGELEAAEGERDVLRDQVEEQFEEINSLRDREEAHLETIAALQERVQKNSRAYRTLKRVWTAASVVPGREV
ncbi:hypothetical protein UCDDA912_g08486 [Diaporthe ampelina]|uniref:Uncharacterized protein n=1 Tax=Diaporthe ampelina TaxID=1214573 RepID=A0A0G2HTZ0_9PEZI|nr:hypothetical protein UCDDA912_g08486 [Diaporthe ampelina]